MFGFIHRIWADHLAFKARKQEAAEQAVKQAAEESAAAAAALKVKQREHYKALPIYRVGIACPACGHVPSNVRLWRDDDYGFAVMRVDCNGCHSYFCCRPLRAAVAGTSTTKKVAKKSGRAKKK